MMHASRAAIFASVFCLASPGGILAECAWVLWGRATAEYPPDVKPDFSGARRQLWSPRSAHKNQKEYEVAAKDVRAVLASLLEEFPLRSGQRWDRATEKFSPDDRLPTPTAHVRCLPDTIDLRESNAR